MPDLDKLYLTPISAGYGATPPTKAIRTAMDGGQGAYSAEFDSGTSLVDVTFSLDRAGYQYIEAFMRNRTGNEAEPFLIDLVLDGAPTTEYTAYYIPGSRKLGESVGPRRSVSMQLEVLPAEVDEDFDSSIVDLFEVSGGDIDGYLDLLAQAIAAAP